MSEFLKKPPRFLDVIPQQWAAIMEALERIAPNDRYLHWDQLKDEPEAGGVSHEAWWAALKVVRLAGLHAVGLKDRSGRAFAFGMPDGLAAILYELDKGRPEDVVRPVRRQRPQPENGRRSCLAARLRRDRERRPKSRGPRSRYSRAAARRRRAASRRREVRACAGRRGNPPATTV